MVLVVPAVLFTPDCCKINIHLVLHFTEYQMVSYYGNQLYSIEWLCCTWSTCWHRINGSVLTNDVLPESLLKRELPPFLGRFLLLQLQELRKQKTQLSRVITEISDQYSSLILLWCLNYIVHKGRTLVSAVANTICSDWFLV